MDYLINHRKLLKVTLEFVMFLRLLSFIIFLALTEVYSKDLMSNSMFYFRSSLEDKCKSGKETPLSKDLFREVNEYDFFIKQLGVLLIKSPSNACDFLKHPQVLSAVSILPQLNTDLKEKEFEKHSLNRLEEEYGRKFYIFKLLELKELFPSAEKESIEKKRALNAIDFYLKGLVACIDVSCPHSIYKVIIDKIPPKISPIVYGKNIGAIFLDENNLEKYFRISSEFKSSMDLNYNYAHAIKKSLLRIPSKDLYEKLHFVSDDFPNSIAVISSDEWVSYLYNIQNFKQSFIVADELNMDSFVSKNVIGFASSVSNLLLSFYERSFANEELRNAINQMSKTYNSEFIVYESPDWKSKAHILKLEVPLKKEEIDYEINYFNVYGVVNSDKGKWFLLKDEKNKEFWINQSQFNLTTSISSLLLDSKLSSDVSFYESPGGTKTKITSSNLAYKGFYSKSFRWIKDQLWILIDTKNEEVCSQEEDVIDMSKFREPVKDLWIKAFRDDGGFNFIHQARGC